jgi:hypothetical protein
MIYGFLSERTERRPIIDRDNALNCGKVMISIDFKIRSVSARKVLDLRGIPTLEDGVATEGGASERVGARSGKSRGS